jgi:predicted phosphodiesterase
MSRILIIGDTHIPAIRPGYLEFVQDVAKKYRCNKYLHIGDVVDFCGVSRHEKLPEHKSPEDEYEETFKILQTWYQTFPKLTITEGNHDLRVVRQAAEGGIPQRFLKTYNELFGTPKWTWVRDCIIDDIYYSHGMGCGGTYPASTLMRKMLCSCTIGHIHTAAGISWAANKIRRIFGLSVGTGVDDSHLAFAYAQNIKARSILSCAVCIDGIPYLEIMPVGVGERYNKRRFK